MSEQAATWQRVTVAEAAEVLGVSTATVRRMVRRGQLDGERIQRPQGTVYVVRLPHDATGGAQQPSATRQAPGDTPRGSATVDDRSQAIAAWAASLLAPITAELGEARQVIVSQAEKLQAQAETIGSLTEQVDGRERELDRSSAEIAALSGQLAEADVSRRRYVGIANALAIVLAMVMAGVFAAMAWLP